MVHNFLTGFWVKGDKRATVWGRPASLPWVYDRSPDKIEGSGRGSSAICPRFGLPLSPGKARAPR